MDFVVHEIDVVVDFAPAALVSECQEIATLEEPPDAVVVEAAPGDVVQVAGSVAHAVAESAATVDVQVAPDVTCQDAVEDLVSTVDHHFDEHVAPRVLEHSASILEIGPGAVDFPGDLALLWLEDLSAATIYLLADDPFVALPAGHRRRRKPGQLARPATEKI